METPTLLDDCKKTLLEAACTYMDAHQGRCLWPKAEDFPEFRMFRVAVEQYKRELAASVGRCQVTKE